MEAEEGVGQVMRVHAREIIKTMSPADNCDAKADMNKFIVGDVFRYARPYDASKRVIDGLLNHFRSPHTPGCSLALLERGINPIGSVVDSKDIRRPAILIRCAPLKIACTILRGRTKSFLPNAGAVQKINQPTRPKQHEP
jgi:hypothetical protein